MKHTVIALLMAAGALSASAAAHSGDCCKHACRMDSLVSHDFGYTELTDTKPRSSAAEWQALKSAVTFGWGSTDVRYPKHSVPSDKRSTTVNLAAWRGERVHAQAVIATARELKGARLSVSDLRCGKSVIKAADVSARFVRYVMADTLNEGGGGCGYREVKSEWDSVLVADVIDIQPVLDIEAQSVRPVWVSVSVPRDARPGTYRGTVTLTAEGIKPMKLQLDLKVVDRTLPEAKEWALHLDMWQNPYAVARYYKVPLWSQEHFDLLRPLMTMLRDAGQRAVTTTIIHKPWNAQTEDYFDSMVGKTRNLDGSWSYDYTVFDRWVDFMLNDVGIDEMISCYTMIPWDLKFDYYDRATNSVKFVRAAPGSQAYADYWVPFLKDFAQHLRAKGWFGKTVISMDERPMKDMQQAIKVIRQADPEFKISLAGNYHAELLDDLQYLSIPYGKTFPADVLAKRRERGQISTVYTCCTESFPNIFTFSPPAEGAYTPLHALAAGYDGFLRWTAIAWTKDPLRDSRFRMFASGDTYSIYPGPRPSIRFERFAEGLQQAEKVAQLRRQLQAAGDTAKLKKLDEALRLFTPDAFAQSGLTAAEAVQRLTFLLNTL